MHGTEMASEIELDKERFVSMQGVDVDRMDGRIFRAEDEWKSRDALARSSWKDDLIIGAQLMIDLVDRWTRRIMDWVRMCFSHGHVFNWIKEFDERRKKKTAKYQCIDGRSSRFNLNTSNSVKTWECSFRRVAKLFVHIEGLGIVVPFERKQLARVLVCCEQNIGQPMRGAAVSL